MIPDFLFNYTFLQIKIISSNFYNSLCFVDFLQIKVILLNFYKFIINC